MSYSIANEETGEYYGHAGSVHGFNQMADIAEEYNESKGGSGKIPYLISFLKTGTTENAAQVVKDISRLLAAVKMDEEIQIGWRMVKESLSKAGNGPASLVE